MLQVRVLTVPLPITGLLVLYALTACGPADNDPGPGGVTVSEARLLDEAAEMLESQQADLETAAQKDAEREAARQNTPAPQPE